MNQEQRMSQRRTRERKNEKEEKQMTKMPKLKNRQKISKKNPLLLCWPIRGSRSRVLHRLSQIVYSNNISTANQKTVFGGRGVHFFPKKSPPTGSVTLKKRAKSGLYAGNPLSKEPLRGGNKLR